MSRAMLMACQRTESVSTNSQRASSFGWRAHNYDTHRRRYPAQMIDGLVRCAHRVLDWAPAPGLRRAEHRAKARRPCGRARYPQGLVAQVKCSRSRTRHSSMGAAGRRFDPGVFAASFQWVDPAVALPKITRILDHGGKEADLEPTAPTARRAPNSSRSTKDSRTSRPTGATEIQQIATCLNAAGAPSPSGRSA